MTSSSATDDSRTATVLVFPTDGSVGTVVGWTARGTAPIDVGPARGEVRVPYPLVGLRVDRECGDLSFLEDVGSSLDQLVLTGDAYPPEELCLLRRMPRLWQVGLSGQRVDDRAMEVLSGCHALTGLMLFNTTVSDLGVMQLAPRSFRTFLVSEALSTEKRIGDRSVEFLAATSPALQTLVLWYTGVTDDGLRFLGRLRQLESLYLDGCPIDGSGFPHLGALKRLARLNVAKTNVTDASLEPLTRLPALERLKLTETGVTDASVATLLRVPSLRVVWHDGSGITSSGSEELRRGLAGRRGEPSH